MADINIYLFGAPRLEREGDSIHIQRRRALALFAYLVTTGKPHSRDSLAALLWPEHDQSEARAGLRRELFRLKRDIGADMLLLEGDLVSLAPGMEIHLDVRRFQKLVKCAQKNNLEAKKSANGSISADCHAALTEAAELYQGDFMAGFSLGDSPKFDDWQFFHGESLRQALAEALQWLIEWHRQRGEYERAIEYARRWLALDNLHEESHRQLMELYARAGQHSAAVRQYQECVRLLRAEIGVEPEQETQALYEIIHSRKLDSLQPIPKPVPAEGRSKAAPRIEYEQKIGYCSGYDGVKIAYAEAGEGPVFLKTANWLSHLEYDWDSPVWVHWLTELARDNTLVRYDIRACGLSDWKVDELSQQAFTRDLETVVDHLGLKRFPLLGLSGGGPAAITYAVRHPEKVSHLILYGTYARGRSHRGYSKKEIELGETLLNMIKLGWGQDNPAFRQFFTSLFMPEATGEQMHWFNDLQRISTSPENAYRLEAAFFQQDVSDIAAKIRVPTLVLHAQEDGIVPFVEGTWLAQMIPDARFVPLESKNHILLEDEPAWEVFLQEVRSFLATDSPVDTRADELVDDLSRKESEKITTYDSGSSTERAKRAFVFLDEEPLFQPGREDKPAEEKTYLDKETSLEGGAYNFPKQQTPFIGRKLELVEIQQYLLDDSDCRLLTILGPGGMGKTRLAVEAATSMRESFPDGAHFVPLRSVSDAELVAATIADVLHLGPSASDDPLGRLLDFLHNKDILLVLDNFEHLLDAALMLSEIIERSPEVKILVTSRHALNVIGEQVYPLKGLPFPTSLDNINNVSFSSVQLFAEHASRVRRDFSLADNLQAVSRICRLVEGIPLAIELAASWARTLSADQIVAEIQHNIEFLATRMRDVEESHRSILAVFDQSWSLLNRAEQSVFTRLSVFRGGFEPEAARQITAASLSILTSLADKSLVRIESDGRYQIHELLRQYGEERLAAAPEEFDRIRDSHCTYYADFMQDHLPGLLGGDQREQLSDVVDDIDNIRAAWQWAVQQKKLTELQKLLHGLDAYFQYQSRYLEGVRAYEKAAESLQSLEPSVERNFVLAQLLDYQGWFHIRLGQFEQATLAFEQSRSIYAELAPEKHPPVGIATDPLIGLTMVTTMRGNYDQAISLGELAREQNAATDDRRNLAFTYYTLTSAYMAKGEYDHARQCAEQAHNLAKSLEDNWFLAYILNEWGNVSRAMGRYAEAKERYLASYDIRESFNDPEGMAVALNHLGRIALLVNDHLEAKGLYQHSLSIYQDISDRGGLASSLAGLGEVYLQIGDHDNARQHLRDALRISLEIQHVPLTLSILICVSELYWQSGISERAVELLSFVSSYPASERETRERASDLLDRYKSSLPEYQFAAIQDKGEERKLDEITQTVSVELNLVDSYPFYGQL